MNVFVILGAIALLMILLLCILIFFGDKNKKRMTLREYPHGALKSVMKSAHLKREHEEKEKQQSQTNPEDEKKENQEPEKKE